MTSNVIDIQTDEFIIEIDEEFQIQLQNLLFEQVLSACLDATNDTSEETAVDVEYEEFQAEYDMLLKAIEEESNEQENLKNDFAEIKLELDDSPYIEEMNNYQLLQDIYEQKSRKVFGSFTKKLTKEQLAEYQVQRVQLEQERNNSFRVQKLTLELESAQLENRELVAIRDQKQKRHDNIKKTYDEVMARRDELLTKKENLEKELEELTRESTTSCDDESSEDDINLIL